MPTRAPTTEEIELRCPRDGGAMRKAQRDGATIDECATCGGLWLDASELRAVSKDAELEALASRVIPIATRSPFGCPRCWGDCEQTHVGGVTLDTCTSCHGVWLDAGELPAAEREALRLRREGGGLAPWQRLLLRVRFGPFPEEAADER